MNSKRVVGKKLGKLLGLLRAMNLMYENAHWETMGPNFYGDHQMFEELYAYIRDEYDTLAEKMVPMCGAKYLHIRPQGEFIDDVLEDWSEIECLVSRALEAEVKLQSCIAEAIKVLKHTGMMTHGMEDHLQSIANNHEKAVYFLTQRLK